jgi:hypothetical protein
VRCGKNCKEFLATATLLARNSKAALVESTVAPIMASGGVCRRTVGFVSVRLTGIWRHLP